MATKIKDAPKNETARNVTISVYIPQELSERLWRRAEVEQRSLSQMASILLEKALKA